jgi:hypothetical protein
MVSAKAGRLAECVPAAFLWGFVKRPLRSYNLPQVGREG